MIDSIIWAIIVLFVLIVIGPFIVMSLTKAVVFGIFSGRKLYYDHYKENENGEKKRSKGQKESGITEEGHRNQIGRIDHDSDSRWN